MYNFQLCAHVVLKNLYTTCRHTNFQNYKYTVYLNMKPLKSSKSRTFVQHIYLKKSIRKHCDYHDGIYFISCECTCHEITCSIGDPLNIIELIVTYVINIIRDAFEKYSNIIAKTKFANICVIMIF